MNKKFSKTLINHYTSCFEAQKWAINRAQNFWKWNISWNQLHKHWHNNIKEVSKF